MTREHVFARWLVREAHGAGLVPSDELVAGTEPAATAVRISRVVADVCAECNAGWLSGLEVSFRLVLFARSRVGMIPMPDRVTLSRWFAKMAVLLAEARGIGVVGAAHRAQFLASVPADVEVFLARRRRPRQRLDLAFELVGDAGAEARRLRSVAILVDDLVGHVAPRGALSSRHGTRLWPSRSHTMRWETLPAITPLIVQDTVTSAMRLRI